MIGQHFRRVETQSGSRFQTSFRVPVAAVPVTPVSWTTYTPADAWPDLKPRDIDWGLVPREISEVIRGHGENSVSIALPCMCSQARSPRGGS